MVSTGVPDATRAPRTLGRLLFLFVLVVYGATAGGSLTTTDAVVTFELTRSLVDHGSVALSGNLLGSDAHRGVDGRYYSPFGIAQSVYNIPFYVAGVGAARLVPRAAPVIPKAAVALGNVVPMAACCWVVYLFAWRLTESATAAASTALAVALATPAWSYAKFGFNAPLSALFLTLAMYLAWRGVRARSTAALVGCGTALGAALLTRHEFAIAIVPVLIWIWKESDDIRVVVRRTSIVAAGLAPAWVFWLAYNYARFGHPLDSGYLRDPVPGFGSSIVVGLYGLLLSPAASVLVYAPLTLLCLAACWRLSKRDVNSALLLALPLLVLLLFYAQLGNWMGGRSYGPRYLMPALPLCAIPLACWFAGLEPRRRHWLRAACLAAFVVQLPGVLVDYAKVSVAYARSEHAPTAAERLWDWRRAPLVLNARTALHAVPANVRYVAGLDSPPAVADSARGTREFSQQFAYSLDFWWLYLFYMGVIGRGSMTLCVIVPVVVAGYLYRRVGLVASSVPDARTSIATR